jgi:hypothetical protein
MKLLFVLYPFLLLAGDPEAKLVRNLEKQAALTKKADNLRIKAVQELSRYCVSIDKQMLMTPFGSLGCLQRQVQPPQETRVQQQPAMNEKPLVVEQPKKDPPAPVSAPSEVVNPKVK